MTNLVSTAVFLFQLVTNSMNWDDGAAHASREWYYDHAEAVGHPTHGYEIQEVSSNYICRVEINGAKKDFTICSTPVLWRKVEWTVVESRDYHTNDWRQAAADMELAVVGGKPEMIHVWHAADIGTGWTVTNDIWLTNWVLTNGFSK